MSKKLIYLFVMVVFSAAAVSVFAADKVNTAITKETALNPQIEQLKVQLKALVPDAKKSDVRCNVAMDSDAFMKLFQQRVDRFIIKSTSKAKWAEKNLTKDQFYEKALVPLLKKAGLESSNEVKSIFNRWVAIGTDGSAVKVNVK
jgi:hypothetical protein